MRGRKPKAPAERELREAKANTTDPDSRLVKASDGQIHQGYNAQAVATEGQLIVCAELVRDAGDQAQLVPMVEATKRSVAAVGMQGEMQTVVADAGYWSAPAIERVAGEGLELLVATKTGSTQKRAAQRRRGAKPVGIANRTAIRAEMDAALGSGRGKALYGKRQAMIEPIFGDAKFNRGCDRFMRRGFDACQSEWRLIAATHNLLKLWRHHRRSTDDRGPGPHCRDG